MTLRPELIEGLRLEFANGATVSGLLRYLLNQHTDVKLTQSMVRNYLMQAFGIDFHQRIQMDIDNSKNDQAYALVDTYLIPEIVDACSSWYSETVHNHGKRGWLDTVGTLPVVGAEPVDSDPRTPISGISESSWAKLSPSEQQRFSQMQTSSRTYWRHLLMLAQLCERLQRRITELDYAGPQMQTDSKST